MNVKQKDLSDDQHGERVLRRSHRRKHSVRCKLRFQDVETDDPSTLSPKYKHRKQKENVNDDSRIVMQNNSTAESSGFMDELTEKDSHLLKYKSRYSKLEKSIQEIQLENNQLQALVNKKDLEYKELEKKNEELLKCVQKVEKEKVNVLNQCKKLAADNAQLNEDVTLLKVLIYRLNVELERYQDKIRLNQKSQEDLTHGDADQTSESKRIAEAWGRVNFHALGPLLEAYQENIIEKEELINQFKHDLDYFSGRCKEIVAENEELRKDIEKYKSMADKFTAEMQQVVTDATVVKEENDILMKQVSLQKQKLQEIHHIYEKKVESMSQDNNKLYNEYIECRAELSNIQGRYEILSDGYEKFKKNSDKTMPVSVHLDAIEECKRLFEELKSQYELEKKKLLAQIKKLEETNPENEKLVAQLTVERDHLKQLTRTLEKNFKRSQHKAESYQNALQSVQTNRESLRKQLHKMTIYCDELVRQQERLLAEKKELINHLREKEKENESIQYLGGNIVQRMGTLKNELKNVQKGAREQLETVEKTIKSQELGFGQMKSDYQKELQRLKQVIKQKEDTIGKLQREKHATQDNLELVWKAATSDDKKVKDVLKNTKIYNI